MKLLKHTSYLPCALSLILGTSASMAQSPTVLQTFSPTPNNYQQQPTGLVTDAKGNLYRLSRQSTP